MKMSAELIENIVDSLKDDLDKAIAEVLDYSARELQAPEFTPIVIEGYDLDALHEAIEAAVPVLLDRDRDCVRVSLVDVAEYTCGDDIQGFLDKYYLDPAELVSDWMEKWFRVHGESVSTIAYCENDAAQDREWWGKDSDWDFEALEKAIESELLDLAMARTLSIDNDVAATLNPDFWQYLCDMYCTRRD